MAINSEGGESYVIVAFGDIEGPNGLIRSERVFEGLFMAGIWYTTRPVKAIKPGTHILFYENKNGFKGSAVVRAISNDNAAILFGVPVFFTFARRLELDDRNVFEPAVNPRTFVDQLDFVSNKKYWGHAFRSTPRKIPKRDYQTIICHAKSKMRS